MKRWALIGIFLGLGLVSFLQGRMLWKASGQEDSSSTMMTQAVLARLNGISLGISAYLQNHDADSLERIKTEGREVSKLFGEFKEKTLQDDPDGSSFEHIEKAHEQFREATVSLLAADHAAVKAWNVLNDSNQALMSLLSGPMQASIKPSQLNSTARLRAVRSALEEAKSIAQFPAPGHDLDLSRAHFRRAMAAYEELSRTSRSGRWAEEARSLFDQCVGQTRAVMQTEDQKQAATSYYTERLHALVQMIQEKHATFSSRWGIRPIKQAIDSGLAYTVFMGVLLLAGMALVFTPRRNTEVARIGPLQNILQCVEAASTGDTSRLPEDSSRDVVGRLAQGVGRLITVLARSENLVYHLAALVESSGEAIISHTLDGTILSWNKGAQRIYGYSATEVKGRSITLLSPDDGGAGMMSTLQKIRQGERLQPFETLHQARNGRTVRAFVRVSAILDSTRKVIGASFCAQDLTDTVLIQQKAIEGSQTM